MKVLQFILLILIFASCQPVARYQTLKTVDGDTAEIKDCEYRLEQCAEDNQALQDSIYILNNHKK